MKFKMVFSWIALMSCGYLFAQNPIIRNQYTADPSVRVFGDKVYLFPSHDIFSEEGKGRIGWFCMEDYHVFSSANLTDWEDHGMIVTQNAVDWVRPNSYSMWAPDCIERNGKYYFYYPTSPKDTVYGRGFTVGVAIADKPEGPYKPQSTPIKGIRGIDPNVFIDKDGQAYIYWSQGNIYGAKLKENMTELASEVFTLAELPKQGLKEGPYMIERNGIYYMTYPHVENKIERLEYAIGDNPLGPFKIVGAIMDESPTGCWTNHHSMVEFKGQWYLFYHHNDYSPNFDKARSVRADSMFFNADGTIQKVIPTLRGIGVTKATDEIQLDRYSEKSGTGATISFVDNIDKFKGWTTTLDQIGGWVKYNTVDFGNGKYAEVVLRARNLSPTTLELRSGDFKGTVLTNLEVPASSEWKEIAIPVTINPSGIHHLTFVSKQNAGIEIDWIRFK